MISRAVKDDLPEILDLQLRAFGEVAQRLNAASLPPLEQTIEQLLEEEQNAVFYKYTENGHIIGSVRGSLDASGTCHVGRLIVDPYCRNRGIGRQLMQALKNTFREKLPGTSCSRRRKLRKPCTCTANWVTKSCTRGIPEAPSWRFWKRRFEKTAPAGRRILHSNIFPTASRIKYPARKIPAATQKENHSSNTPHTRNISAHHSKNVLITRIRLHSSG